MKNILLFLVAFLPFLIAHSQSKVVSSVVIAKGQMPNIASDKTNNIHIVYGSGDSIMYTSSKDGKSFGPPSIVAVLPKLFASAMRGPQIAATTNGLIVTACTKEGNIYSFKKLTSGNWTKATIVNDAHETAKEALMALSADGYNAYAVWLGVRGQKGQNLYGARSADGGKTWAKNNLVYASPDSTVCECCKPSVAISGTKVYVMFRNWLNGARDLYLITSLNGGKSFGKAQKLGTGTWKLKGCPMDGGGLAISKNGNAETVWRREGKIYAALVGKPEKEIGEGRSCSIETIGNKKVYAWTESGNVVVMKPNGDKVNLGKGSVPLLKSLNNEQVICVWENNKEIHSSLVQL